MRASWSIQRDPRTHLVDGRRLLLDNLSAAESLARDLDLLVALGVLLSLVTLSPEPCSLKLM